MTPNQSRMLSAMVTADPDFRRRLLSRPKETARDVMGIALSAAECAEILRQAEGIRDAGQRADQALESANPSMLLPLISVRGRVEDEGLVSQVAQPAGPSPRGERMAELH